MSQTYVTDGDLATPANMNTWLNLAGGNVINVTAAAYGAVGDGATDDTDAIQAAIDDIPSGSRGGVIYFPPGVYLLNETITLDRPIRLEGSTSGTGARGAVIQWTGGASPIIDCSADVGATVKSLSLNNTGSATVGIDINNAAFRTILEDVVINPSVPLTHGIRIGNDTVGNAVVEVHLDRVTVTDCTIGISALRGNLIKCVGTRSYHNDTRDLVIGDSTHAVTSFEAFGCSFEGNPNITSILAQNIENALFSGCYFENDGTGYLAEASGTLVDSLVFDGCRFIGDAWGNNTPYVINVNLSTAVVAVLNSFFKSYPVSSAIFNNQARRRLFLSNISASNSNLATASSNTGLTFIGVNLGSTAVTNWFDREININQFIEGIEIGDPDAPSGDRGRLYFKDNGAGKTQLVVRFATGAVQVVATEP